MWEAAVTGFCCGLYSFFFNSSYSIAPFSSNYCVFTGLISACIVFSKQSAIKKRLLILSLENIISYP